MRSALLGHLAAQRRIASAGIVVGALGFAWIARVGGEPGSVSIVAFAALVQTGVGSALVILAHRLRRALLVQLAGDPAAFHRDEKYRVEGTLARLRVARFVASALLTGALGILIAFHDAHLALALAAIGESLLLLGLTFGLELHVRAYERILTRFLDPKAPVTNEIELAE